MRVYALVQEKNERVMIDHYLMPPTEDPLDRSYRGILHATLAACRARQYKVQWYDDITGITGLWGSTSFSQGASEKDRASSEAIVLKERMTEWLDMFIEAGVLKPPATVCVHVSKELVHLPGIIVVMWT